MIELAVVLLVDRSGRLLLQLRDDAAPNYPRYWGLPGGHCETAEAPPVAAGRELWEETRLVADDGLRPFVRQELPELGLLKHYFYGSTCAEPDDIVVGEGEAIIFLPPAEVLDGRPLTPGTRETIRRFVGSAEYAALADGTPLPYDGDDAYADWAYLHDRYVCPLADEHRTCHRRASLLRAQGNADGLRALAAGGHRCAFTHLMRLLVDGDRRAELRAIAVAGDGRAEFTLYEHLKHRCSGDTLLRELRAEAEAGLPRAPIWLARCLADNGHTGEALAVLATVPADCVHADEAAAAAGRISGRRWAVRRQDDNGNRFTVGTYASRAEADDIAATMEVRGHRQLYWVEAAEGPAAR